MSRVLIVEDDVDSAHMMAALVEASGFTVSIAHSLRDARRQLVIDKPELVLLDLQLPDGRGLELFEPAATLANTQVVLITGHASLDTSIQALRLGAGDYLIKPVSPRQLEGILSRVMAPSALNAEIGAVTEEWKRSGRFGQLWGRSEPMQRIYDQISRVTGTSVSVLITGESGTGKELVARTLHDLSRRRHSPYLAINCGAISPNLIESEIFGHEKGSFTGADRQHLGFFERANGGTLFLDEITEMPLDLQVKLLRVLETGTFLRVGSAIQQDADVRIVAATNRSPEAAMASGRLREDLYYRLNVFPMELPALRDRSDDIALLAKHFVAGLSQKEGSNKQFSQAALTKLSLYRWPGNVRELRNVVQRSYVMTDGAEISDEWLPINPPTASAVDGTSGSEIRIALGTSLADAERQLILGTLRHFKQHKELTAAALGVSLKTLYNRLKEYAADAVADK